jgi:hypothetical protein
MRRLFNLPGHVKEGADLLQSQGQGQRKASALKKKHSGKEPAVGPLLSVDAPHADGETVKLQLQVCFGAWCCCLGMQDPQPVFACVAAVTHLKEAHADTL